MTLFYKFIFTVIIFYNVTSIVFAGESKKTISSVVLELGKNRKIHLDEFKDFYNRYSGKSPDSLLLSKQDADRFYDLFVKYELKLADAKGRHLDTSSEVRKEVMDYRNELAKTYLLEQELTVPAIKKMYDRRKTEIRARHILFKFPEQPEVTEEEEDSTAEPVEKVIVDTNAIRAKAVDALRRLNAGEKFEDLVKELTEDAAGKNNGGDLYYFTTGQMVPAFEDACYTMKVGETSKEPVLSTFGFHIIQVTDKKTAVGSLKASHIMARFNSANPTPDDTMQAWKKITALQDSLHAKNADFAAIAKRNSDDAGSAANGGDVGSFQRRRWVQPFDEAAFKLKVGQISDIIRTPYGYHIIKCTDVQPIESFEKLRDQLKSQYQSSRFGDDKTAYVGRLKVKYGFKEDEHALQSLLQTLDTSKVVGDSAWMESIPAMVKPGTLFSYAGKSISIDSVLKTTEALQENSGASLVPKDFKTVLDRVYEHFILLEEAKNLEQRYPEFAKLMLEFQDGIILYRAEQEEMWSKITVTDSALQAFFSVNREKFRFPNRVNISAIWVGSDTLAHDAYQRLKKGESFDTVALTANASILMRLKKGALDWLSAEEDTMTRRAWLMEKHTFSEPFLTVGKGWTVMYVNDKDSSRQKTYEEAGSEVSNAYQDAESKRLETHWLDRVKKQFPPKEYRDVVTKALVSKKKK